MGRIFFTFPSFLYYINCDFGRILKIKTQSLKEREKSCKINKLLFLNPPTLFRGRKLGRFLGTCFYCSDPTMKKKKGKKQEGKT